MSVVVDLKIDHVRMWTIHALLQGFAKPISDLSRGASVDDIVATTAVTLAQI